MIGRREFVTKGAATAALLSASVSLAGCSVWTDIINWVPVGEASLNSILSILSSNGVVVAPAVQTIVSTIEAGFTALVAAVKEYQSATPPPVGALDKIHTAFNAILDNFSTFLKALNVSGGLLGLITGLAQVVYSTIDAFLGEIPTAAAAITTHAAAQRAYSVGTAPPVVVVPVHRTRRAFKKDFNSMLDSGTKIGVNVPSSAYLKLTLLEHL